MVKAYPLGTLTDPKLYLERLLGLENGFAIACTKVPGLPEIHSSPVLCSRAAKIRERWETQFTRSEETRGSTIFAKKDLASLFQGQTKRKAREDRMRLGLSTSELFQGSDYVYQWSWGLGDLRQWFIKGVRAMTH